jgi:hypothetical protein
MFHVRVEVPVHHTDREVEIIKLKERIDKDIQIIKEEKDTEFWSCEEWAKVIFIRQGAYSVEVSEDGENGAIIGRGR